MSDEMGFNEQRENQPSVSGSAESSFGLQAHKHLDCNVRDELKLTSLDELASAVEDWIAS